MIVNGRWQERGLKKEQRERFGNRRSNGCWTNTMKTQHKKNNVVGRSGETQETGTQIEKETGDNRTETQTSNEGQHGNITEKTKKRNCKTEEEASGRQERPSTRTRTN